MLRAALAVLLLSGTAFAGNGAPNGAHYNLNILGKTTCSPDDLVDTNRHVIQVKLNYTDADGGVLAKDFVQTNKIWLAQGPDFAVLDGNACDANGAKFQLPPNPFTCDLAVDPLCEEPDFALYDVYARAPGRAGGQADMTTCGFNAGADGIFGTQDDETVCSTENVVLVRDGRNQKFTKVTKELTTVYADFNGDGLNERIGIFDPTLQSYYWDYDNQGLRIAQLRFYLK